MKVPRLHDWRVVLPVWLALVPAVVPAAPAARIRHADPVEFSPLPGAPRARSTGGARTWRLAWGGRVLVLALHPNTRLLDGPTAPVELLAGAVSGVPGSWVRLAVRGDELTGLLWDGHEYVAVEPARRAARFLGGHAPPGGSIAYRLADLALPGDAAACGLAGADAEVTGAAAVAGLARELQARVRAAAAGTPAAPTRRLSLNAVADWEFYQENGAQSEAEVLARINIVDGLYTEQLGVQVAVDGVTVFQTASDPFRATDGSTLLDEVADFRLQNDPASGATHLLTARTLDSNHTGYAFFGSLCVAREAASLSSDAGLPAAGHALVVAHELGHNFGAPHDAEAGSACESTPPDFLMAPRYNGSNRFSSCSLRQVARVIAGAQCLAKLADYDVALVPPPSPRGVPGQNLQLLLTADNQGNLPASGLLLSIAPPPGLHLAGANASPGSCDTGPSGLVCGLASLATGATWSTTLTFRADVPGEYDVQASLAADADANPTNDAYAVPVIVEAPVDLGARFGADLAVTAGGEATTVLDVDNHGPGDATGVQVTFAPSSGLEIASLAPSQGTCVVTGTAGCSLGSVPSGGQASVTVRVKATTAGSASLDATVRGNGTDPVGANDAASLAVQVSAPAAGGGGALDLAGLALAGFAGGATRRRGRRPAV